MAVSLKKGEGLSLLKEEGFDLSQITVGLGWDIEPAPAGSVTPVPYDLDAIALLRGADGKVRDLGQRDKNNIATLVGGDVVFFNSQHHHTGKVWLTGDSRTGSASDEDDEQIVVQLAGLPDRYDSIVFAVVIYNGRALGQSFAAVRNAHIRARDARGTEICRFQLGRDPDAALHRAITFAEVSRQRNGWAFRAIGTPHETDRLVDILKNHL